jgi:hypothetical protein
MVFFYSNAIFRTVCDTMAHSDCQTLGKKIAELRGTELSPSIEDRLVKRR